MRVFRSMEQGEGAKYAAVLSVKASRGQGAPLAFREFEMKKRGGRRRRRLEGGISAQNEKGIVCGVGKRVCGTERKQTSAKQRTGRRLCVVDAIPVVVEAKPCGSERFFREMKAPAIAKL